MASVKLIDFTQSITSALLADHDETFHLIAHKLTHSLTHTAHGGSDVLSHGGLATLRSPLVSLARERRPRVGKVKVEARCWESGTDSIYTLRRL